MQQHTSLSTGGWMLSFENFWREFPPNNCFLSFAWNGFIIKNLCLYLVYVACARSPRATRNLKCREKATVESYCVYLPWVNKNNSPRSTSLKNPELLIFFHVFIAPEAEFLPVWCHVPVQVFGESDGQLVASPVAERALTLKMAADDVSMRLLWLLVLATGCNAFGAG